MTYLGRYLGGTRAHHLEEICEMSCFHSMVTWHTHYIQVSYEQCLVICGCQTADIENINAVTVPAYMDDNACQLLTMKEILQFGMTCFLTLKMETCVHFTCFKY